MMTREREIKLTPLEAITWAELLAESWTDEEWAEYEEMLREYAKTLPEVRCG